MIRKRKPKKIVVKKKDYLKWIVIGLGVALVFELAGIGLGVLVANWR